MLLLHSTLGPSSTFSYYSLFLQRDKQGQAITMWVNELLAIITIIVDSHAAVLYLLVMTLWTIPERKNKIFQKGKNELKRHMEIYTRDNLKQLLRLKKKSIITKCPPIKPEENILFFLFTFVFWDTEFTLEHWISIHEHSTYIINAICCLLWLEMTGIYVTATKYVYIWLLCMWPLIGLTVSGADNMPPMWWS